MNKPLLFMLSLERACAYWVQLTPLQDEQIDKIVGAEEGERIRTIVATARAAGVPMNTDRAVLCTAPMLDGGAIAWDQATEVNVLEFPGGPGAYCELAKNLVTAAAIARIPANKTLSELAKMPQAPTTVM